MGSDQEDDPGAHAGARHGQGDGSKLKHKLVVGFADARRMEAGLESLCKDEPPDPSGRWRPQDHLAHLAWSRDWEATLIAAVVAGGEIPPDVPEEQNNLVYEATRNRSASEVIAGARASWDRIESVIEACSEEDLARPHPHRPGRNLAHDSPGNHLGAHMMWAYLEAGDEGSAEAVQVWARDLSSRVFDDPRSRGVAAYNLGCFYARAGRAQDAVPLLREGFEGAPDLKEWALKDPDLDPIRQDPLFIGLVPATLPS